jgi:hypothetical protein
MTMNEDHITTGLVDGEAADGRVTVTFSSFDGRVDIAPAGPVPPLDEAHPALELSIRTADGAGRVAAELSMVVAAVLVDEIEAELERLQEAAR